MSKTIIFTETKNRKFKRDGDEFCREAVKFDEVIDSGSPSKIYALVDGTPAKRLNNIIPPIDTLAFFCHGTRKALIHCRSNIWSANLLAGSIAEVVDKDGNITICLYTCSTGKGNIDACDPLDCPPSAGYAMRLGAALYKAGVTSFRIIAHTKSGHTTRNPFKVEIRVSSETLFKSQLVEYVSWWGGRKNPEGRRKWLLWCKLLKGNLRFKCAYMTEAEIETFLSGRTYYE